MELIYSNKKSGYEVKVHPDFCAESPREWDNIGIFRLYTNDPRLDRLNQEPWEGKPGEEPAIVVYVGYRPGQKGHADEIFEIDSPNNRYYVGTGAVSHEAILETFFYGATTPPNSEVYGRACWQAYQCLRGEIEQLNMWLGGQVFGYVLEGLDGDYLDSLWGLYGLDYAIEEADRVLEAYAIQQTERGR